MPEGLSALALLACPAGMGLMMWLIMRGGHRSAPSVDHEKEMAQLRADVERLRAAQDRRGRSESPAPQAPNHR